MRLEASWAANQNPETDAPTVLRWSDGTHATAADFARIDGGTQSMPDVEYDSDGAEIGVTFSYEVR
jgi:hypothetical protein